MSTTSVVLARDWGAFGESLDSRPPLLEDLLTDGAEDDTDEPSADDLLLRLREAPEAMRADVLGSFLQGEVKAVLRLPTTPASTVGFFDLGMDSLMAVELRNRLNRAFAGNYTASNTVVFDYPDIATLAAHLADELAGTVGEDVPPRQPEPAVGPVVRPNDEGMSDGIAIVGMACRFPGAPDLSAFWHHLESGSDAVTDARREAGIWSEFANNLPKQYAPYGKAGFVDGIDMFDARFFGISPIEARLMDPQQRMLLETTWLALEDAGIDPDGLKGSSAGVYAGIASSEYRDLMKTGDYGIGYLSTAASMAVGRLSHRFGLGGPAMPVELNCASSLVAVHQAVTDLRLGTANLALAGGVSSVLSAPVTREMADLGLLSKEGACRTFDAKADGFVRGEGCGMVILKRLAEAEADGNRILAVIRGSAVNQNGAAAGATVPSGPAQERVIEQALSQAGIPPSEVDYLETHGAGSAFGDSIEVQAAAAVYGRSRAEDRPLLIGSVKTNIGHLESAAGVAGLIKTVLAMDRRVIPRHLHFRTPSPLIEWDRLPLRVTKEATDWPRHPGRLPRAGISAFGISGVNAHVVLEAHDSANGVASVDAAGPAPEGPALPAAVSRAEPAVAIREELGAIAARRTRFLPLSGKSVDALRALAGRYLAWLDGQTDGLAPEDAASGPLLSDMAWTAGVGRSHLDYRAGAVFHDATSLRARLTELAAVEGFPKPGTAARVAFVYPGELGGCASSAERLYETESAFRTVLDRCEAVIRSQRDESLLDRLFHQVGLGECPDDPEWAQPAVYALACSFTALWLSLGIRPSLAVGRGAGELAAAQAAGVFGLEDGLRLAAASINAETALERAEISAPSFGLVNGSTGQLVEKGELLDATYWRRRDIESASWERYADILEELEVDAAIEMGPRTGPGPAPVRDSAASDNGAGVPVSIRSLGCPTRDGSDPAARTDGGFMDAVAEAYEVGIPISFEGLFACEARRRISLPGYPFQRRRHWLVKRER